MYLERLPQDLSPELFSNVKYYITGEVRPEVVDCLDKGGARKSHYLSTFTTHLLVGEEAIPEDITEAEDMLDILPVHQDWVLASAYVGARLPLSAWRVSGGRLLSGLRVCLGPDLTERDRDKLWAMVTWHGGTVLSGLGQTVTHLVTSRLPTEERADLVTVTPNWVVESVVHNKLLDTDREDFRQFSVQNENKGETHQVPEEKKEKKKSQKLQPSVMATYLQQQNDIIVKFITGRSEEERNKFYKLDTERKREFVSKAGLAIRVVNGEICLTEYQREILFKSEEQEIVVEDPGKDEELEKKQSPPDQTIQKASPAVTRFLQPQNNEKDDEEDERVRRALINMTPKSEKKEFKLTKEQEKIMLKMNRQQRHLYVTKLKKEFAADPDKYVANQKEERSALDNISNMRPATVRTPSRQLRDSSQSIKTVDSPNSPYVGQSSDKPVSAKICLLGCTFLITGYHERAESEYVHKWRVVIERHGGQLSDTLTDQVCTICCVVCKSVRMDI